MGQVLVWRRAGAALGDGLCGFSCARLPAISRTGGRVTRLAVPGFWRVCQPGRWPFDASLPALAVRACSLCGFAWQGRTDRWTRSL